MKRLILAAMLMIVPMATAEATSFGAVAFCRAHPEECVQSGARSITLTDEVLHALDQVNRQVNRIPYQAERIDEWTLNPRHADCEDYAITKRHYLARMGVPTNAMRIASVVTRNGEPHAVLIVRTSAGDLMLDNIAKEVTTLEDRGYSFKGYM